MRIRKSMLKRIIAESVESQVPSFMMKGERYTEDERRPHNRPGVNGKPMDFVLYSTLNPKTGTPGSGSLTVPQGMSLEDFYAAGGTAGFADYYKKPETGADMNRAIKAAEERGDWDNWSQNEGTELEDMPDSWRQILGNVLKDK